MEKLPACSDPNVYGTEAGKKHPNVMIIILFILTLSMMYLSKYNAEYINLLVQVVCMIELI